MSAERRSYVALGALVLVTVLLIGWRIGVEPLGDWDEALTGSRTLGMLETGDLLTVHLNGAPDFHKPPLYYALAAAAAKVAGAGEAAMRFPGFGGAAAITVLVFFLGRWIDGPICGLAATLAYVTTSMFIGHGRQAQPDMVLYAMSLAAIFAFVERAFVTSGVLVGAALLTKGLAGGLAPMVIGIWWSIAFPRRSDARREALPLPGLVAAGAVAAAIVLPWLAWNALHHAEGFGGTFVGAEVTQRIGWASPFGRLGAYYASVAFDTLGPTLWIGLLGAPALVSRLRSGAEWRRISLVPAFVGAAVIALSITHPKNAHYILIPALALALGVGLTVSAIAQATPRRAVAGIALLTVASALALGRSMPGLEVPWSPTLLAVPLAAGATIAIRWPTRATAIVAAIWSMVFAAGAAGSLGEIGADGKPNRDLQLLSADIQRLVPAEATLLADRPAIQGVVFYSRRRVAKAPGFFLRATPLPERLYGAFRSDLDSGIVGYDGRKIAGSSGLRLVELSRDPDEVMPSGPRTMTRGDDAAMEGTFRLLGVDAAVLRKGPWVSHVVTARHGVDGRPLPRDGWRLDTASPHTHADRALDGSSTTVWQVAGVQAPGLAFTLDVGRTERLTRLLLETDDRRGFPRGLAMSSSTNGSDWTEIARADEFHPGFRLTSAGLDFGRDYAVEIGFAPREARYLRLEVTVAAPFPWRIAEIRAFAADDHR